MGTEIAGLDNEQVALLFTPIFDTERALQRYQDFKNFVDRVLKDGVDYGAIPGTGEKPTLLKPGAEKLCTLFGLSPRYTLEVVIEDWRGEQYGSPLFYYRFKCQLYRGNYPMGEGVGSCSSWESKYRYRWVNEEQARMQGHNPETLLKKASSISEFAFAIKQASADGPYGKPAEYWAKWAQAIADGKAQKTMKPTRKGEADAYVMGSVAYRIPNPDFADIINTVQKIALKRAYVAATVSATNASEYFTQDLEDYIDIEHLPPVPVVSKEDARAEQQQIAQRKIAAQQAGTAVETWDWRIVWPRFEELIDKYSVDAVSREIDNAGMGRIEETKTREQALKLYETVRTALANPTTPTWVEAPHQAIKDASPLTSMLERASNIEKRLAIFKNLRLDLVEAIGEKEADLTYRMVLAKHGAQPAADGQVHANAIAKDPGKSKAAITELYQLTKPQAVTA